MSQKTHTLKHFVLDNQFLFSYKVSELWNLLHICSACDSLMWSLWKKWTNFNLHFSRIYHQFNSFFKENCFAHMQCIRSSYFKICDEEINLRYEDRHYWLARLRAIKLHASCLENCLICSLPSGLLFPYFCHVLFIYYSFELKKIGFV